MKDLQSKIFNLLFKTKEYVIYLCNAKNEYSIHSPFVFNFYTKGIKNKKGTVAEKTSSYFDEITVKECNNFNLIAEEFNKTIGNAVLIIENIHSNKNNQHLWEKVCKINGNFASLDFFSTGVVIKDSRLIKRNHYILWK